MGKRGIFTKTMVIAGTVAVWVPLLAPFLISAIFFGSTGLLRFDYLMPAELFGFALVGGLLLVWGGARSGLGWRPAGIPLGVAALFLVLAQGLAMVSGLASGRIEAKGFWMAAVVTLLIVSAIAMVFLGIAGIRLIRRVFARETGEPLA